MVTEASTGVNGSGVDQGPDVRNRLSKLADTTSKIDVGHRYFLIALNLLRDPQRFYADAGTSLRRALKQGDLRQAVRGRRPRDRSHAQQRPR